MASALTEDLLEEVLFRIPPDDPASLVRAALASKRWCRLICGRGFRRRYREFHGTPPLLGFVRRLRDPFDLDLGRLFIPTTSFRPPRRRPDRRNCTLNAVHSSHGRVLLHSWPDELTGYYTMDDHFVWDFVTDKLQKLPKWPLYSYYSGIVGNAAVLCAGAVAGDGCNHLDCNHGAFMVVFVGIEQCVRVRGRTFVSAYSSEADEWSKPVYTDQRCDGFKRGDSVVIGSAVYFKCSSMSTDGAPGILKYDLLTREISTIHIPRVGHLRQIDQEAILLAMEDGVLGLASIVDSSKLYQWSWEHGSPDGDAGWALSRVMDLEKLLQTEVNSWTTRVLAFADNSDGGVIFISSCYRLFSLSLKSGSGSSVKVVRERFGMGHVVAYMSFCTPALRAVSVDDGPGPTGATSQAYRRSSN